MTKSRIGRTGSGYQASVAWVTRPGTGKPNGHSDRHPGRPDRSGRRRHVLPREVSSSVQRIGLPHGPPGGMGLEKSAEAIVAGAALWFRAKGRIFRCREQSGETRWVDRPAIALPRTGWRFRGAVARRNQPAAFEEAMATHGIPSATGLGAGVVRFHLLKKPPY